MSGAREINFAPRVSVASLLGDAARSRRKALYCCAVRSRRPNNSSSSARRRSYVRQRRKNASWCRESKRGGRAGLGGDGLAPPNGTLPQYLFEQVLSDNSAGETAQSPGAIAEPGS